MRIIGLTLLAMSFTACGLLGAPDAIEPSDPPAAATQPFERRFSTPLHTRRPLEGVSVPVPPPPTLIAQRGSACSPSVPYEDRALGFFIGDTTGVPTPMDMAVVRRYQWYALTPDRLGNLVSDEELVRGPYGNYAVAFKAFTDEAHRFGGRADLVISKDKFAKSDALSVTAPSTADGTVSVPDAALVFKKSFVMRNIASQTLFHIANYDFDGVTLDFDNVLLDDDMVQTYAALVHQLASDLHDTHTGQSLSGARAKQLNLIVPAAPSPWLNTFLSEVADDVDLFIWPPSMRPDFQKLPDGRLRDKMERAFARVVQNSTELTTAQDSAKGIAIWSPNRPATAADAFTSGNADASETANGTWDIARRLEPWVCPTAREVSWVNWSWIKIWLGGWSILLLGLQFMEAKSDDLWIWTERFWFRVPFAFAVVLLGVLPMIAFAIVGADMWWKDAFGARSNFGSDLVVILLVAWTSVRGLVKGLHSKSQ